MGERGEVEKLSEAAAGPVDPRTFLVGAGRTPHRPGEPLNTPLVLASTFRAGGGPVYARDDGTPGWAALEEVLGGLEGGAAVVFSSGMAAIAAVLDLLPAGAVVVAPADCYSGTRALLDDGAAAGRWRPRTVPNTDAAATAAALDGADLLWLETPSNPLLEVADIAALAAAAHRVGALVACDNTFASPLLQQPLAAGADIVVHSATKLIGGHSDLLLGAAVAVDADRHRALRRRRELAGATPGALECFLALRGLRTLGVRLDAAQAAAGELARRLAGHPAVRRVHYPGLPGDPGHALAGRQMRGFGAVLSFELADADAADAACAATRVVQSATSLGGVESTMERRAKLPGQEHLPPGLLRLSVGCEHVEDLWRDLRHAIAAG